MKDEKFRTNLLNKLDNLSTFEKIEFLNSKFLKAKTIAQEFIILELINQVKIWG